MSSYSKTDLINLKSVGTEVESSDYMREKTKTAKLLVPNIDFSDPANFANYGSSERYYADSINYILLTYPYDGSYAEKQEWWNEASYLDQYMFENKMIRNNGYVEFSVDGWGALVNTIGGITISDTLEYIKFIGTSVDNIYDESKNRESNLELGMENTIEFVLDKTGMGPWYHSGQEVILDLWNGEIQGTADYARLAIILDNMATEFRILYNAQGTNYEATLVGSGLLYDGSPHHYAITLERTPARKLFINIYRDSILQYTSDSVFFNATGSISKNVRGFIGAYQAATVIYPTLIEGCGKLEAKLDEFRFWKTIRTPRQIGQYYNFQIGGGTNTDDANTDLGIYYKFNEGITTYNPIDKNIIDYSGRNCNGTFVGYPSSNARSTDSLMINGSLVDSEYQDLVIYDIHPDVVALKTEMEKVGKVRDSQNGLVLFKKMHSWIQEEDFEGDLEKLTQIMGAYFDTLNLQIKGMLEFKSPAYCPVSEFGNVPFGKKLLSGMGFPHPDLFTDATLFEKFFAKSGDDNYEADLEKVKNFIYNNIYKNLSAILKSKGTEKSFGNLLRCFGIDSELIKFNMYQNNGEYIFDDEHTEQRLIKKKFVRFSDVDNHGATIYNMATAAPDDDESYYFPTPAVPADSDYIPITVECEVVFPKLDHIHERVTTSIFGMHEVTANDNVLTFDVTDVAMFNVYAVRNTTDTRYVKFRLESAGLGIVAQESAWFFDVYNHTHWTFAMRFANEKYFNADMPTGSTGDTYQIELYGVNHGYGEKLDSFILSATGIVFATGQTFCSKPKRLYIGANRTDFNGAIVNATKDYSDCNVGSLKYWLGYIEDEQIDAHGIDPTNVGTKYPVLPFSIGQTSIDGVVVPQTETLALNWEFDTNTITALGAIDYVYDVSGGGEYKEGRYDWVSDIVAHQYPAEGYGFDSLDTEKSFSNEYLQSKKQQLPENVNSSEMVYLKENYELEQFEKGNVPTTYKFSLEKSMYQSISEEMMKYISLVSDFGQLFGEGVNRYRMGYKKLDKMRHFFFEKIANVPDVEKYINYYKWIDGAINIMLQELIPAGEDFIPTLSEVVESHILERSKVWNKFPNMLTPEDPVESRIMGIEELRYNYLEGSPKLEFPGGVPTLVEDGNELWWNERADRDITEITSGSASLDADRESVRDVASDTIDSVSYNQGALRRFQILEVEKNEDIEVTAIEPYKIDNRSQEDATTGVTEFPSNYIHDYEIANTSGRKTNNRWLKRQGPTGPTYTPYIPNPADPRVLPDNEYAYTNGQYCYTPFYDDSARGEHKDVFVCRFSAPGDKFTSGGFLDRESLEISAYNAMPYRNVWARAELDKEWS